MHVAQLGFRSRVASKLKPNPRCNNLIGGDMTGHHCCNNCALEPPGYTAKFILEIYFANEVMKYILPYDIYCLDNWAN